MEGLIGWTTIAVIAIGSFAAVVFASVNGLSLTAVDPLLPMAGAIILACGVSVKKIWLDAPKGISSMIYVKTIEYGDGTAIVPIENLFSLRPSVFMGLSGLRNYSFLLTQWEMLPSAARSGSIDDQRMRVFELAFWSWMSEQFRQGWLVDRALDQVSYISSGFESSSIPPEYLMNAKLVDLVDSSVAEKLRIDTNSLGIMVPAGSKIITNKEKQTLRVDSSASSVVITLESGPLMKLAVSKDDQFAGGLDRILKARFGPASNVGDIKTRTFRIKISQTINPFSRFSKQAKLEAMWIPKVIEEATRAFSWSTVQPLLEELISRKFGT